MKLNISAQSINSNNYEHIIPSRDVILSLFDKVKNHLSHEQISRSTGLDEKPQKDALKKTFTRYGARWPVDFHTSPWL